MYNHLMLDWWLKTCESRPWRTFLLLWLILIAAFLLLGIAGYEYVSQDDMMPPKEAVPYHFYLPDPSRHKEFVLENIDPNDLPVYDANLQTATIPGLRSWGGSASYRPPSEGYDKRLVMDRFLSEGKYGWPLILIEWRGIQTWDVTDPFSDKFEHAPHAWKTYWVTHDTSISCGTASNDGSRITGAQIFVGPIAFFALLLELLTFLVIFPCWFIARRRIKKRIEKHMCLQCGHALGPEPRPDRCPECGTPVSSVIHCKAKSLFGRLFSVIFVLLLITFVVLIACTGTNRPTRSLDQIKKEFELRLLEQGPQNATPASMPVVHYSRNIGFIDPFINYSHQTWYLFVPGAEPVQSIPGRETAGLYFATDDYLMYRFLNQTTGEVWTIFIPWTMVSILIVLLQITALVIAIILRTLIALYRRTRNSPKPA